MHAAVGHPSVVSVIPGAFKPEQVKRNVDNFKHLIHADLWAELKSDGLFSGLIKGLEETRAHRCGQGSAIGRPFGGRIGDHFDTETDERLAHTTRSPGNPTGP